MAISLKEKNPGTLMLVVIIGVLIGSYLNTLVRTIIPGQNNVVKNIFTTNITFGIGDFGAQQGIVFGVEDSNRRRNSQELKPFVLDLNAIKFQAGFQMKLSLMSVVGIFLSLYFFRWYK
ncbi:MAG: DUF4321 domain-containing protein [Chitinivibrionales bacterium]|nr:DUF4321 domain-containing protein [Chitinivibrionales bacterium]